MRNLEAFIDKNRSKSHFKSRLNVKNSIFYCIVYDDFFGQEAIKKILNYISNIEKKFCNQNISICIDLCSIKLYHNVPQYATNGYNTVNQLKIFAIVVKLL